MTITAATLIANHKAHKLAGPLIVRDLSDPERPVRLMTFSVGQAPSVIVRRVGARPAFLERIELLERDADVRLARYVVPDMSMLANADV